MTASKAHETVTVAHEGADLRSPRISSTTRRRQWLLVALLFSAGCVNYLDRSTLAVANNAIASEMHLSPGEMGALLSVFAWAYALCQVPAGLVADRIGPRIAVLIGLFAWSAAQVASGAVRSFGQFLVARVALGVGESPMFTASARATVSWFPERDRGLPLGIVNAASSLGPALAPPVLTALMLGLGWRPMFVAMGLAGFVVALAWALLYREPRDSRLPPADQTALDETGAEAKPTLGSVVALLREPATGALMGGAFGTVYVTWLYVTWLPAYLETVRHLDAAHTGWLAAVPQGAGFVGACLGGLLSDRLARRGVDPIRARKGPAAAGLLVASAFVAAGPFSTTLTVDLACMSGALFFAYAASSCGWALGTTLAPPGTVATLEAIQNIGGSFGGALAPLLTGLLVEHGGGFTAAFICAAAVAVLSGISFILVGRLKPA